MPLFNSHLTVTPRGWLPALPFGVRCALRAPAPSAGFAGNRAIRRGAPRLAEQTLIEAAHHGARGRLIIHDRSIQDGNTIIPNLKDVSRP